MSGQGHVPRLYSSLSYFVESSDLGRFVLVHSGDTRLMDMAHAGAESIVLTCGHDQTPGASYPQNICHSLPAARSPHRLSTTKRPPTLRIKHICIR